MSPIPVCVIFDIGKTNKKTLVFNQNYEILAENTVQFEEISDQDGYHGEDLKTLVIWIKNSLRNLIKSQLYDIKAINFSSYGASFVHLDEAGNTITPLYNYLKSFPYDLRQAFFAKYGPVESFSTQTASPDLGMLNSGLQLYWLKHTRPDAFKKCVISLHLPQYFHYIFTKKAVAEITSIGCHTAMWDFGKKTYHQWLLDEALDAQQAAITSAEHSESIEFENQRVHVGIGIHDSSGALMPYLKHFENQPFVLLSTGTWNISLNPFNQEQLSPEDLRKDCLCFLNFRGEPVKAARLFAGNEHERHTKLLADHFDKPLEFFNEVNFDRDLIRTLRGKFKQANPLEVELGSLADSPFVERNLNQFGSYEQAYHQFMLDLVAQQMASLKLVLGRATVKTIFVEGGFSNNVVFMNLLQEACPNIKIRKTKLKQASALGAALLINDVWGGNASVLEEMF